ncbi:hypothetical protein Bca4012_024376 [Brassica carinata]
MVKCDHFSIRGYVAETRERDHNKCWPFPEESVILVDQESYSLPCLSVPKFRWWRCMSCIRDINADETKDCGLHPNSRSISGKKIDGNSTVSLTQSKLNSLAIIDQEKERRINNNTGDAVDVNEDVNCKRSHKDDRRATTFRNKVKKLASQGQGRNKRAKVTDTNSRKEKHNVAVTTFGSSEIAGVVEDTPPKAIKNLKDSLVLMECDNGSSESINLAMTGLQRRKTRKVRRLSELLDQPETKTSGDNIRKEESSSSKKRGRKRKVLPENNYVSRKLITVRATSDQDYSTSTDSGFERDVIKGRQKNRRFQVVDEFVPSVLPCETSKECVGKNDHADLLSKSALSVPCPLSAQRTEKKLSLSKKKKHKPVSDNGKSTLISFSSQYTPGLLNDRFASEGYFRKPIPQVNDSRPVISLHMPENDHVRSREAEAHRFGSSSKPNTGGWFSSNNNNNTERLSFQNFNLRSTSCSTEVADQSSVMQKDASGADRKGKTVMFQEHHGEPKRQSHDRKENTPEDQNDDIPMEIVELLAKNQYERCLPDKEEDVSNNKQPSQEPAHKPKNTLLIDLNETYDNAASLEDNNNNTSRPPKPYDSNARREEQHIKSLDFFPINQPYVPSPFGIFPPPQENRASSNIRFSGQTCQWLGNVPTMATQPPYRVLRPCNTCQSVPHQYRDAASQPPMWATTSMRPPQCHHRTPVSFNMDPSTKLGMLSQAPPSNENTWNLNFVAAAANGKQKCGSSSEFSFGCKHGNNSRSVEAFSSESSIPALHLLSLMDPRVGPNSTPSDHQGNTNATKRHFPHVSQQPKERVEIQTGDSSKTASYPTKLLSYDYHNKSFAPKSFPIVPPLGTSSFSFQNAQAPWIHHQEKKTKRKEPVYSSPDQGKFQLLGASDSMKLPLKFHVIDKEKKQNRKAESLSNASTWPLKNSCGPIVCSVSRNPADFTIAEPGNVYMLTGESLKVRKRAIYKKKSSLSKEDALNQTKKPVLPVTQNA